MLWTATWNVGGLSADKMLEVLDAFGGSPELHDIHFVLLQEIITEPGLHHAESDSWQIVFGKMEGEFRGEGVAHTTTFSHHRSRVLPGAVTTQLRSNLACTVIAGHIPHHATIAQTEAMLSSWRDATQTRRAILGFDAKETFTTPPPPSGRGCYASTGRGHTILNWLTREDYTIPPQQLHVPSYHPYNHSQQPRRIDYLATKHITAGEGKVLPIKDRAASDHDAITTPVGTHKRGGPARTTWGPRRLRPEGQIQKLLAIPPPRGEDPHQVIAAIAKAITLPGGGSNKFQESQHLKQLRHAAQQAAVGPAARQAWKLVSRTRKQEHRAWMRQQAKRAANLDWRAMRSLQTHNTHRGWHLQLQDDPQWQDRLGEHMQNIFAKPQPPGGIAYMTTLKKQLRRRCKHKTWAPFSHEELQRTSNSWAHNRSTGPDGISHEAAKALLADIQWGGKLAYLLNDMFYTAHIPESIDRGITVLLPKIPCPLEWGDTRPITLSSTLLKWASQLLLARAGGHIRSGSLLQWARAGRQGVELVATIRRVTQMARDWGIGTWLVKLDIRKAFDSVWQHRMGGLVAARVGGVASDRNPVPPELGGLSVGGALLVEHTRDTHPQRCHRRQHHDSKRHPTGIAGLTRFVRGDCGQRPPNSHLTSPHPAPRLQGRPPPTASGGILSG